MAHKQQQHASFSSYEDSKTPSSAPKAIRSGTVTLRERGTFRGTAWRPKRLELDDQWLTIINASNAKRTRIALTSITELERTDLTDHSLSLRADGKLRHFSFATDSELYDWQDDIYRRCPLGNYSEPFDFVHKSHIGSGQVAGTFTDPNILPIYAEIIGAQPTVARSSSGIIVAPRSRPVSGVPLAAITKGVSSSGSGGNTILEGLYVIKQAGLFAGWMWKQRWLTLTPQALVVHSSKTKTSAADKHISLPTISSIEPDAKRQNCLVLEYGGAPSSLFVETLCINFLTSTELYTWRDALYLRSAMSLPIGTPTNFVHKIHVGFDSVTGVFTGLPTEWAAIMNPPVSAPATSAGDRKARRQSRRKSAPLVQPPPT